MRLPPTHANSTRSSEFSLSAYNSRLHLHTVYDDNTDIRDPQAALVCKATHYLASPRCSLTPLARHTATPSSPSSVTSMRHAQRSSTPSRIDPSHTSAFWQAPCARTPSARSNVLSGPRLSNTPRYPRLRERIRRFALHSRTRRGGGRERKIRK